MPNKIVNKSKCSKIYQIDIKKINILPLSQQDQWLEIIQIKMPIKIKKNPHKFNSKIFHKPTNGKELSIGKNLHNLKIN